MRAPPPLRWHCADVRAWRAFSAASLALACAVAVAWGLAHAEVGGPWSWLLPLCASVVSVVAGWRLVPPGQGVLEWTGAAWTWHAEGLAAAVELSEARLGIDLDSTLLLRLRASAPIDAGSRTAWVIVQRTQDPAQWPLLCALLGEGASAALESPRQG
jgi:hypothetical protein